MVRRLNRLLVPEERFPLRSEKIESSPTVLVLQAALCVEEVHTMKTNRLITRPNRC